MNTERRDACSFDRGTRGGGMNEKMFVRCALVAANVAIAWVILAAVPREFLSGSIAACICSFGAGIGVCNAAYQYVLSKSESP